MTTAINCNCIGWNNTVTARNPRQKNGALFVGFMMDDPVRPYMQYEATGEFSFCPWCGQVLLSQVVKKLKNKELWQAIDEATK